MSGKKSKKKKINVNKLLILLKNKHKTKWQIAKLKNIKDIKIVGFQ